VTKQQILRDVEACYENRPYLAMVDSSRVRVMRVIWVIWVIWVIYIL
jgi:monomeric isocitrate dehydrogenase